MHIKDWKKEVFTIPNLLSLFRLALIPVYIYIYLGATETYQYITAGTIMAVSCLTDLIDGKVARRFNMVSTLGKILDPLADKIFVVGTFVMMAEYKLMPGWIIIVVLTREFMVTGLRMLATHKGVVISADKWGKLKTILQMIALLIGGAAWVGIFNIHQKAVWIGWYVLLLIMTLVTILSGLGYFIKNKQLYMENT